MFISIRLYTSSILKLQKLTQVEGNMHCGYSSIWCAILPCCNLVPTQLLPELEKGPANSVCHVFLGRNLWTYLVPKTQSLFPVDFLGNSYGIGCQLLLEMGSQNKCLEEMWNQFHMHVPIFPTIAYNYWPLHSVSPVNTPCDIFFKCFLSSFLHQHWSWVLAAPLVGPLHTKYFALKDWHRILQLSISGFVTPEFTEAISGYEASTSRLQPVEVESVAVSLLFKYETKLTVIKGSPCMINLNKNHGSIQVWLPRCTDVAHQACSILHLECSEITVHSVQCTQSLIHCNVFFYECLCISLQFKICFIYRICIIHECTAKTFYFFAYEY